MFSGNVEDGRGNHRQRAREERGKEDQGRNSTGWSLFVVVVYQSTIKTVQVGHSFLLLLFTNLPLKQYAKKI